MKTQLSKSELKGQFRLKIIGGLLASPPDNGDLIEQLSRLAEKEWLHPISGEMVKFSLPTLERWYYKARKHAQNPVRALSTPRRIDKGKQTALSHAVCAALNQQYIDHDSWTVQLHYDNLLAMIKKDEQTRLPSYSSVLRYMRSHGLMRQSKRKGPNSPGADKAARRLQQREVRSYQVDYVNGLWHLDFHHGSLQVVNAAGEWVRPILLAIMDDRSRLICHLQWYYSEDTECLVHGFCQALQKRALPRSLLSDNGAAMISAEFTRGLHELSIDHQKTLPYSPYQNGKQETFWANVEGRLLALLENQEKLTLRYLNHATQAWVEMDYHQRPNKALDGQTPIHCYLQHQDVGRLCPNSDALRAAFRKRVNRKQRRSDGTISLEGRRFEIPAAYAGLTEVTVRYASWDLSSVDLMDVDRSIVLATLYPLNKSANADGLRRSRNQPVDPQITPSKEAPALLQKLMLDYAATGLPQSYLPKDEIGDVHE